MFATACVFAIANFGCSQSSETVNTANDVAPVVEQTVRGGPPGSQPVPEWVADQYVNRSNGVSISVHKIVVTGNLVTLFYSIEFDPEMHDPIGDLTPQVDSETGTFIVPNPNVVPVAHLTSNEGVSLLPSSLETHAIDPHTALCSFSFDIGFDADRSYSVIFSELNFRYSDDGAERAISGRWKIPVMRLNDHRTQTHKIIEDGNHVWEGRSISDRGDVAVLLGGPQGHYRGYVGDSPRGWIATTRFSFFDQRYAFFVSEDGGATRISDELYFDVDELFAALRESY